MASSGRVTLKQALREYPGDVRSAAARVRDEWRKLTAPKYPRLRLPKKPTPAELTSRLPEEKRAREFARGFYRFAFGLGVGWWVFSLLVCAAVYVTPPPLDAPATSAFVASMYHSYRALAGFCMATASLVFFALFLGNLAFMYSRYGEWVTKE